MSWGRAMTDMARSTSEKVEAMSAPIPSEAADYPYGLCISLDHDDLEKLDLDDNVEAGDMVHLVAFAKVTSVSKRDIGGKTECRVELQIQSLAVEDENNEASGSDDGE